MVKTETITVKPFHNGNKVLKPPEIHFNLPNVISDIMKVNVFHKAWKLISFCSKERKKQRLLILKIFYFQIFSTSSIVHRVSCVENLKIHVEKFYDWQPQLFFLCLCDAAKGA